ncbi:MAG: histidine kinase dimerization/phosphoacceptor domain -containing protein, partial [Pseudomonadota bacterium]|nr:histidine kinase dimerization/phosphoacceptor domain -containing protein [Pseudomonadota bacterium]
LEYATGETELDASEIVEKYRDLTDQFESLNRIASLICETPVSLVNMLDENFQYTISSYGDWEQKILTREHSACQFTVQEDNILVINDTLEDTRASNIKELTEDASVRFYAGVPLTSDNGHRFGAFCVIDYEPKELDEHQRQALRDLGKEVEFRIKLLQQNEELKTKNEKLSEAAAFLNNSADILWAIDPDDFRIIKSKGADPILGIADDEIIGKNLLKIINHVQLEDHITNWVNEEYDGKKLSIPVEIESNTESKKWLNLTLTLYQGKILATGRNITQKHKAEENLKESLEEKEILLSEVHHRVKNNLAVVSSLIQLERMQTENGQVQKILLDSENRIISMAKIHEILYKSKNFRSVDVKKYTKQLIKNIKESHDLDKQNIVIELIVSDLILNANQCLPLGLLINEITTNSIKHAFKNKKSGRVLVQLSENNDSEIECKISDNGIGMDMDSTDLKEHGGLGFTLIDTLRNQLSADIDITSENGTTIVFSFQRDGGKGTVNNYF